MKSGFFKDAPVNRIIITALAVFLVQAALSMYYNNNALTFSGIEAFYSLNRSSDLAEFDMTKALNEPGRRESDSLLYPVLVAPIYKIAGRASVVSAVYVLDLLLFAATLLLFHKLAIRFLGKESAAMAMIVYAVSAPVELGIFSGAAVSLSILLFAAALYFAVFSLEKKKYLWLTVTCALLALNGWTSAVFAAAFLAYALMKMNEKQIRKNHIAVLTAVTAAFALASAALLFWVFADNLTFDYLKNNGLLDIKTWMVDAFFKDGFLWAKVLPPFIPVFFYLALFLKAGSEIKKSEVSDYSLILLLATAALVMEFTSGFSPRPGTYFFMPPFFICLVLGAVAGIREFASYFELKKNVNFTADNIVYGIIVFAILYSCIYTFNRTIEHNGNIQYIAGDAVVSKYMER